MNICPRTALAFALTLLILAPGCDRRPPPESAKPPPKTDQPKARSPFHPASNPLPATDDSIEAAREHIATAAEQARNQWQGKTFAEFERSVFKEPFEGGKYIVNGDIALADRKHLEEFFQGLQRENGGAITGALVVNRVNGIDDVWNSTRKKQLTYCISNGFGANRNAVVADMNAATLAWEQAANVDFIHVTAQDASCNAANTNVLFDVRPVNVDGEYLARAFFPSDARNSRNVLIDASSFDLDPAGKLKLVGILCHELGHVLGWRHEHTRPESGACFEDSQFQPITSYDRFSVMHYPQCNGGGDWSLSLTAMDKAGSACIYGKGSNNTEDLGQCVYRVPDAPATGTEVTQSFANRTIAKGATSQYGPFNVLPGSIATVRMSAVAPNPGDPDLYVRYDARPTTSQWNCRPYLSHANETCELEVPLDRRQLYVMVRGYSNGRYRLDLRYVRPN